MSAVEDFSRYLADLKCVCSHHRAFHLDYTSACLFWHECGCLCYHADNGESEPDSVLTPPPGSNSYNGQYKHPEGGWK